MNKIKVTNRLVSVITVIGFILMILGLLSLFGKINMNSMPLVLISSGIFSILNGYSLYIKNKKGKATLVLVTICIVAGLFAFFVAIFKTFF